MGGGSGVSSNRRLRLYSSRAIAPFYLPMEGSPKVQMRTAL
jgi:hypothetical protein